MSVLISTMNVIYRNTVLYLDTNRCPAMVSFTDHRQSRHREICSYVVCNKWRIKLLYYASHLVNVDGFTNNVICLLSNLLIICKVAP